jgi:ribosomal protein S27AE
MSDTFDYDYDYDYDYEDDRRFECVEGDTCPDCGEGRMIPNKKGNLYCDKFCWLSPEELEYRQAKENLKEGDTCIDCQEGTMVRSKKGTLYCNKLCWRPTQVNEPEEGDSCPKCGQGVMIRSKKGKLYCSDICWQKSQNKLDLGRVRKDFGHKGTI